MKIQVVYYNGNEKATAWLPINSEIKFRYSNYNDPSRTVYADNWGAICWEKDVISISVVSPAAA